MALAPRDRVVLLDTPQNRAAGLVGRRGVVLGTSYEDDAPDVHQGYAVALDGIDNTYSVLPDGLAPDIA
jgi:hypothetical protein